MRFEVLVVPDCPHAALAEVLLGAAVSRAGLSDVGVDVVVVEDEATARVYGFVGSPSFFLDGADLLPAGADSRPAVACRVYRDERGELSGLPAEQILVEAVQARAVAR